MNMSNPATPNTGIFSELEGFFENAWTTVKTDAVELFTQTETLVVADLKALWAFAAPLAINAVIAEAKNIASGQEKFGNAVASVVQDVEAAGKPILVADGQALVQNAYNYIQSKLPVG
jgi:hypothetical protein